VNNRQNKEEVTSILQNCNHDMAKQIFIKTFKGNVMPSDLCGLLDRYIKNPCVENAQNLYNYDAEFLNVFLLARSGGFTTHLFESGVLKHDVKK
jgi:hypothetical protein